MEPYIGITDFTNFEQVEQMLSLLLRKQQSRTTHKLHVGVMMSYKTLNGIETKWSKAFPPKETIVDIFSSAQAYNCIHYADYDSINVEENVRKAIMYSGPYVHAIQLDMVWPDPQEIRLAVSRSWKPNIEVILQVGGKAIEECGDNPEEVVKRLKPYIGIIHRVLLDKSMGRGLGMDAKGLIPFAKAISKQYPFLGLVAAGGLGPGSVNLIKPLLEEFRSISMDAQGKLRSSGNALDPIDWDMAADYINEALAVIETVK